jgi:aminopeptidase
MSDPRLDKLANVLMCHSTALNPGDFFQINAAFAARPLVEAILKQAPGMEVYPVINWQDEELSRLNFDILRPDDPNTERFLNRKKEWELYRWQDLAANISIRATENDQELNTVPAERIQMGARIGRSVSDVIINERRWVLFDYPTRASAQKAGMSYTDYFDFVVNVSLIDYDLLKNAEEKLAQRMNHSDRIRILAPGTDLTFSKKNIASVCCYGRRNIPDGEVYTAPIRDSVQGVITYNVASNYFGQTFKRIRLEFKDGRICNASCDGDNTLLNKVLSTDEGASFIGEFSFGVNPQIREPIGNTLFDEKICGSLHFTPGNAYAKADNGNRSAIHWDLIQIQRPEHGGGEIWLDDELVRKDGLFVTEDLLDLNPI